MSHLPKSITIRLTQDNFDLIHQAASRELRSVSNFLEFAALERAMEGAGTLANNPRAPQRSRRPAKGCGLTAEDDAWMKKYQRA